MTAHVRCLSVALPVLPVAGELAPGVGTADRHPRAAGGPGPSGSAGFAVVP